MGHLQVLPSTLEQMIYYLNTYCVWPIVQLGLEHISYSESLEGYHLHEMGIKIRNGVKLYVYVKLHLQQSIVDTTMQRL